MDRPEISRRDRIAVHLLCLTPLQRARLDQLRYFRGPARVFDLIRHLRDYPSAHRDIRGFVRAELIARTGTGPSTRYCLYEDVVAIMDRVQSIARPGISLYPRVGLKVLAAERSIRRAGRAPILSRVAVRAGTSKSGASRWLGRLRDAGVIRRLTCSSLGDWARNTTV